MDRKLVTACFVAAILFAAPSISSAATMTGSVVVEASSSLGTGSVEFSFDDVQWNGDTFEWVLSEDVNIMDGDTVLATVLGDTSIMAIADPVLQLSFNAQAGAAVTNITVSTPELGFPAMSNPLARASAGIVVVDANGNGASWTGGFGGGTQAYRADYNGSVDSGTQFTTLVGNAAVGTPFGAVSMQEEHPAPGAYTVIPGTVTSMDAEFRLTLSAGDRIVGNSVFVVIPEPTTLVLAGVCGLVLAWPRRKLG